MAFFQRISQSKLKTVSCMFKRCYFQVPCAFPSTHTGASVLEKQGCGIDNRRPALVFGSVRFFAAPVQVKPKKEAPKDDGPRLNEQIRARTVRLVTDEENRIVSFHEALGQARRLELDLVEVQRNADPPVCRIMNFHEQKYKKQLKEKERTKSKSDGALKKGVCKEVRFTAKIERKDVQMKADTVIRMIEKGYRVKVMATGKGKEDEDENLGGVLSRLTDLIEGVAVVESGPMVERRQAYVIVRHEKFGPLKKGGGKKSKVSADAAKDSAGSAAADPHGHPHGSVSSEDDPEEPDLDMQMLMEDQNVNENRTAFDGQTPVEPGRSPPFGNQKVPPFDRRNQQPPFPNGQTNPAPSFGIFSGSKPSSPGQGVPLGTQRNGEVNRYASSQNEVPKGARSGQNFPPGTGGRGSDADKVGGSGFGVFSRESTPHGTQNRTLKQN